MKDKQVENEKEAYFIANIHSSSKIGFGRKIAFTLAQSKWMGKLIEISPKLIDRISMKSMKLGRERSGDVPWTPLKRPIEESRVALITTGGIILKS